MELSVVIPINNEAQSLYRLTKEIVAALRGIRYELILVDDGSTDDTDAEVKRARKLLPDLRLLRHSRRRGQSAALLSGIRAATAPWIATLDGDGQNDPRDIKAMMSARANQKDESVELVMGIRVNRRDSRLRRVQAKIANAIRSRVLGDGTPDSGCGIKLFARDTFLAVPKFNHMHLFLPALFQREGARVISVPVRHYPRRSGRSKYGLSGSGLIDLLGLIWLRHRLVADPTTREISWDDEKDRSLGVGLGNHADDLQSPPLVNASREPGVWQTYDVVWEAPVFEPDGKLSSPASVTVFHNGVLVQNHTRLSGETLFIGKPQYDPYDRAPITLQAHGDPSAPISFRNIWVRELG